MLKQITSYALIVGAALVGLCFYAAWSAIQTAAPVVAWSLTGALILAAGAWLVRFVSTQWHQARASRLAHDVTRAEAARDVAIARIDAERAAWELKRDQVAAGLAAQQVAAGLGLLSSMGGQGSPSIVNLPAAAARQAALPAPDLADLLPTLTGMENILIVGGKGTGKTTLMQWLALHRAQSGRVLIFDSHAHPAKWPAGDVIGKGRDYQTIWSGMLGLVNLLDRRYKDFAAGLKGTGDFGTITNMIDELTLLPGIIKDLGGDIQAYNKPILTEGRKVDLCAVWGVHSDRVEALGLKGAADLKECFDAVVYLKNIAGDRYALVDFGEGIDKTRRFRLPGPFAGPAQLAAGPDQAAPVEVAEAAPGPGPVWTVAPEPEPERPTDEEQSIIFHFVDLRDNNRPGFSYNEVARRALGSAGGWQTQKIKDTLKKFGIELI